MGLRQRMIALVGAVVLPALALGDLTKQQANGQENLPVVQRTSEPVKQDDIEFRIVAGSIWPMPCRTGKNPSPGVPAGESPVRLRLQITNYQRTERLFLSVVGVPVLKDTRGNELKLHHWGNNHICTPRHIALAPGKTMTVGRLASIYTGGGYGNCLWWEDELGTNWSIDGLKPGEYSLKLRYDTRQYAEENSWGRESGAWLGDVSTAEIPIKIVDLKGQSRPEVLKGLEAISRGGAEWQFKKAADMGWKDDVQAMALAEATWRAPAAGKPTHVCLGFRLRGVEGWCVRIIPGLAMVNIAPIGGVELPAKKAEATVSIEAPQMLTLRQEFTQTVGIPATLFRAGKTMTLAWADRTGQVWHIENLKPGRYAVRYVIRAEKGEPSQYISYWVGEIRTPAVMIEIKE